MEGVPFPMALHILLFCSRMVEGGRYDGGILVRDDLDIEMPVRDIRRMGCIVAWFLYMDFGLGMNRPSLIYRCFEIHWRPVYNYVASSLFCTSMASRTYD